MSTRLHHKAICPSSDPTPKLQLCSYLAHINYFLVCALYITLKMVSSQMIADQPDLTLYR